MTRIVDRKKVDHLLAFGRFVQGIQVIWAFSAGAYLYQGGAQRLAAPQYQLVLAAFGGYQQVGLSLGLCGVIGLTGLFLARFDRVNLVVMWLFAASVMAWCTVQAAYLGWAAVNLPSGGNIGVFTVSAAGLFALSTQFTIHITRGMVLSGVSEEPHAREAHRQDV